MKKKIIIGSVIVIIVIIAAVMLTGGKKRITSYQEATVEQSSISNTVTATGTVEPITNSKNTQCTDDKCNCMRHVCYS